MKTLILCLLLITSCLSTNEKKSGYVVTDKGKQTFTDARLIFDTWELFIVESKNISVIDHGKVKAIYIEQINNNDNNN